MSAFEYRDANGRLLYTGPFIDRTPVTIAELDAAAAANPDKKVRVRVTLEFDWTDGDVVYMHGPDGVLSGTAIVPVNKLAALDTEIVP